MSRTSLPNEVLRGLGYWFFYGRDKLGPWIEASADYTQRPFFILVSYGVAVLALLSAGCVRWRHRAYFVLLTLVGVVDRGRRAPLRQPDAVRRRVQGAGERVDRGVRAAQHRSRDAARRARARGAARGRGQRARRRGSPSTGTAAAGSSIAGARRRARHREPARALERDVLRQEPAAARGDPAVLEGRGGVPRRAEPRHARPRAARARTSRRTGGATPSTRSRPGSWTGRTSARELIPYGSPASANLLNAFDLRIQDRQLPPDAIAPMARLMSVGDIVLRNDLQFERYRVIRPVVPLAPVQPAAGRAR